MPDSQRGGPAPSDAPGAEPKTPSDRRYDSLSGRQYAISKGEARAVVTEVGAGLRELVVGGRNLVWPYGPREMAGGGRGQVLSPWPNRIEDGIYEFGGKSAQAPINEPASNNAIHGLVRWLNWQCDRHDRDAVEMSCVVAPHPAYPWGLGISITYEIGTDGLSIRTVAENLSSDVAPFGLGFHPYVDCGEGLVDSCTLTLTASEHLVSDARSIPRSTETVAGTSLDFREGPSLEGVRLDDCFTGLSASGGQPSLPEGAAWEAIVGMPDGRVGVWAEASFGYVMCFTGDTLDPADRRRAIAVEPMTCPPNAFRSGESILAVEPGERVEAGFGIRLLG